MMAKKCREIRKIQHALNCSFCESFTCTGAARGTLTEIFHARIKSWLSERNPQPDQVHEPPKRHHPARQGGLVDGENRHLQVCLKHAGKRRTAGHSKSTSTDECCRSLHSDPRRNTVADVPPVHSSRRSKSERIQLKCIRTRHLFVSAHAGVQNKD